MSKSIELNHLLNLLKIVKEIPILEAPEAFYQMGFDFGRLARKTGKPPVGIKEVRELQIYFGRIIKALNCFSSGFTKGFMEEIDDELVDKYGQRYS